MGCWGMGIAQSDEYCEIYDRFMEEYDEGKPLEDIKNDILEEYLSEFSENDGVLHDVYFAIGKAEWMCGGISDNILEIITGIISSGANIEFNRELEATESDLKKRQKNLEKFLASVSTPRGKTKKRKIPTEKYVASTKIRLPVFKKGDIFSYEVDGKHRLLCFINRKTFYQTYRTYCYVWQRLFDQIPSASELTDENIIPLGYFLAENFPNVERLKFCFNNPDLVKLDFTYPYVLNKAWEPATFAIAKEEHLSESFPAELGMSVRACLDKYLSLRGEDIK